MPLVFSSQPNLLAHLVAHHLGHHGLDVHSSRDPHAHQDYTLGRSVTIQYMGPLSILARPVPLRAQALITVPAREREIPYSRRNPRG